MRNKIEPEYDYSKNGMIAKGGGRNYNVRVLYWMLGTLTLNAVKMIDLLLKSQNDIPLDRDQYAIPIKECVRLMFENPYLDPDYG
jgi:hypothetical protein